MTKKHLGAAGLAALTLALAFKFTPAAQIQITHASTPLTGDLYYTTFQTQSNGPIAGAPGVNVAAIHFVYNGSTLVLSGDCPVANLTGADGLIFDPNDSTGHTLIVGEQNSNKVGSLSVTGTPACTLGGLSEKKADTSAGFGVGLGQAYGLATPTKGILWMLQNDSSPKPDSINVATLPLTADGTSHLVTGPDTFIKGVDFIGTQGYYGNAPDNDQDGPPSGYFGTISSSYVTARVPVIDTVGGGTTDINGHLPTHGIAFDPYSGCIIASGGNQIWQLCPPGVAGAPATAGRFYVMAKIVTASAAGGVDVCKKPGLGIQFCNLSNWDQASFDGKGHMFAANNNGDLLFKDFSSANPTHLITDAGLLDEQYLKLALDDIINGGGAPPPALHLTCPASTGTVGTPYSSSLVATGGTPGYTFAITVGALPPPLSLNTGTGAITGTPTTGGTFNFTGKVTDSTGGTALTTTVDCSIVIPTPTIGCVLTPGGYKNHFNYKVIPITFGGKTYSVSEVTAIISTGGGGTAALGRALFTAILNVHYGASAPAQILADITAGETSYKNGVANNTVATELDNFNNGLFPGGPTQECTE